MTATGFFPHFAFAPARSQRAMILALAATALFSAWRAGAEVTSLAAEHWLAAATEADKTAVEAPEQLVMVWRGADVDGDGEEDFANPTGREARGHDAFGQGRFGARRDGGSRPHEGVDYVAEAGQVVRAPISGYVTKIGWAYAGSDLRFVEITNPALNYAARVFYVDPKVVEGAAVRIGAAIGAAVSLQDHYDGITDHVHLELFRIGGRRLDAERLIVARLERRPAEAQPSG